MSFDMAFSLVRVDCADNQGSGGSHRETTRAPPRPRRLKRLSQVEPDQSERNETDFPSTMKTEPSSPSTLASSLTSTTFFGLSISSRALFTSPASLLDVSSR